MLAFIHKLLGLHPVAKLEKLFAQHQQQAVQARALVAQLEAAASQKRDDATELFDKGRATAAEAKQLGVHAERAERFAQKIEEFVS